MGGEEEKWAWEPKGSPTWMNVERSKEEQWGQFDSSSVNAISFGFVATAILISMFLVMAIFERFLRPSSHNISPSDHRQSQPQARPPLDFSPKLGYPSPKIKVEFKEVSVLMPGEDTPTYIAQPVPLQCPPDRFQWPPPKHNLSHNVDQSANTSDNLPYEIQSN